MRVDNRAFGAFAAVALATAAYFAPRFTAASPTKDNVATEEGTTAKLRFLGSTVDQVPYRDGWCRRVSYDLALPTPQAANGMRAHLEGDDGVKVALTMATSAAEGVRTFERVGYPVAIRNPRLVVERGGPMMGRSITESFKVDELQPPRSPIPLVHAIEPSLFLGRVMYFEEDGKPAAMPTFVELTPTPRPDPISILRTDQGVPASPSENQPVNPFPGDQRVEVGQFAEVRRLQWLRFETSDEFDVNVELFDREGVPAIRVTQEARVNRPMGATLIVPIQERHPLHLTPGRQYRQAGLTLQEDPPHPPLILRREVLSSTSIISGHDIELVSPTLEELGLKRFAMGNKILEMEGDPAGPIRYGTHRLHFRLSTRWSLPTPTLHVLQVDGTKPRPVVFRPSPVRTLGDRFVQFPVAKPK